MTLGTSEGKDEGPASCGVENPGSETQHWGAPCTSLTTLKGCLALNSRAAGIPAPCWPVVTRRFEDLLPSGVGFKAFLLVYSGSRKVGTFLLHVDLCVTGIRSLIGTKGTRVLASLAVTTESPPCQCAVAWRARVTFTELLPTSSS